MSQVLVKHRVNSYEDWKTAFDNFASARKSSGEKSFRILHTEDDPNDLTLLFEWDTKENAEKFMASPELKSAMQDGGVAGAPQILFLRDVVQGKL